MRFAPAWRLVFSAWALAFILLLAGFAAVELRPSFYFAKAANPALHGARIPQGARGFQADPFDLGPPAFGGAGLHSDTDGDFSGDY